MMRASSSKSINGGESDIDNLQKVKVAEPHLSGAYIRSLFKELTSSRTKDSSKSLVMISDKQEKSHQQKRKVRRRVQARKPYQERLLNMGEARREIVSALKLHRESMKSKQQMKSRTEIQPFEPFSSNITCNNFSCSSYSWPAPPPPPVQQNLDFILPRQTLGLNLNLQEFYNLVTGPSSIYTSSSASTSSSPALSSAAEEIPQTVAVPLPPPVTAEFRDLDSSLNLVSSKGDRDGDFVSPPFDHEVMGFPGWLNANGSCLEHVDDLCFNNYYFGDYALPCMKIEEIEGVDGEWLA